MKVLVVGNGSTGVSKSGAFYINNHTGYFLKDLSRTHDVRFVQSLTVYDHNGNLQNFDLVSQRLDFVVLPKKIDDDKYLLNSNDINYIEISKEVLLQEKSANEAIIAADIQKDDSKLLEWAKLQYITSTDYKLVIDATERNKEINEILNNIEELS